ncbi:ATP-binding cassette domain-containing protein, partial [Candidatus Aerophobetes bacterium]|nr:ATP-binding cassette domain-containing protein [Candidatus Aerophobetes bacterium]
TGFIPPSGGKIFFEGENITGLAPEKIFRMGISFIPEGRHLFWQMSVRENLLMGDIFAKKNRLERKLEKVYNVFPVLKEREKQIAATLSGGEQQILAVGRALVSDAKLLILDEPCSGVAAKLVKSLFEVLLELKKRGTAILLIDQTTEACDIADYAYIMRTGEIVAEGKPEEILSEDHMKMVFLT